MQRIFLFVIFAVLPIASQSADFGFGASFKSSESTIYFPIKVNSKFMLEPYVRYADNDSVSITGIQNNSTKDLAFGLGTFWVTQPLDSTFLYIGARVAYMKKEQVVTTQVGITSTSFTQDMDGYLVAPTIGFEYFVIEHVSIGGEVAYEYSSIDGDTTGTFSTTSTEQEFSGTRTNILLRYYF